MSSPQVQWPSLIDYPCTVGHSATTNDVNAGRAVFVLQSEGQPIGQPLSIRVPQYAIHIDVDTKARTPCVIIQAEESNGQRIIGARQLPGGELLAALHHEFEFLGDSP